MSVASTAKRRRRQAVNGYRHLAKLGRPGNSRPVFKKKSLDKLNTKAARLAQRRKELEARKGMRNK